MIRADRVEKCLATIETIVSSEHVHTYLIGHTGLSAGQKGDQYRRPDVGFEHLVIIADKMDCESSLDLEDALQARTLWGDPTSIVARKYHPEKRKLGKSIRSHGGTKKDKDEKSFSVYLAWWNK